MSLTYHDFSKMIDHSLLNPTLTIPELEKGTHLALTFDVASVCVMPFYLRKISDMLAGSTVKSSTTIGFPHGVVSTASKVRETDEALKNGGEELDMVVNISQVLSGSWQYVSDDIKAVTETTQAAGQKVKVIFENAYLNNDQKIKLCEICTELNVDWVKTSTGYAPSGATFEDLALMRKHTAPHIGVKAAGGIRDFEALNKCRELGVSRSGATRTVDMLNGARAFLGLEPIIYNAETTAGY